MTSKMDCKKSQHLVLEPTCLLTQGRGDERCWHVSALQESRELQLPHAQCPQCPVSFVPDPLGLEPCRVTAGPLSASVSALLHSSCRAEHRSPDTCTSCPTSPGLLAHPAPATSSAPDAVPDPAAATDHACHTPTAHCCHRRRPHPEASGHHPADHRPARGLRV